MAAAMPRSKAAVNELGAINTHGVEFRVQINLRDGDGKSTNIDGPSHATENEAQKDLDQIRAAGSVGSTREESLKIMQDLLFTRSPSKRHANKYIKKDCHRSLQDR